MHFNLAENRKDDAAPFAFLATYTTRLSAHAKAQHLPLGQALGEYAGAANKDRLLSLLLPVQRASESCSWLKAMVDAGEIFHPLRWRPSEAMQLLRDVPQLESAGVVVRMPATWQANRPPRPQVTAKVGGKLLSGVGQDALLDFRMDVTLDGETLTPPEVRELLAKSDGLALVRGGWVEVDRERLSRMMEYFGEAERVSAESGLSLRDALRMIAGADVDADDDSAASEADWGKVVAELVAHAEVTFPLAKKGAAAKVLGGEHLPELFGLDMAASPSAKTGRSVRVPAKAKRAKKRSRSRKTTGPAKMAHS